MKKHLFLLAALFFAVVAAQAQTGSPATTVQHRVVMQLTTNDTLAWKGLLNNIKNLKNAWGDSVTIEVVAHGPGIELLMKAKTTQLEKIAYFSARGVVFAGCENTLRERNIPKESIIAEAQFVRSGAVEIILKQEKGWSYMKAGF